jgi:ABC-2 type transport system permease protein
VRAPILRRGITTKKWWLFGWSTGIVALISVTLGFYPSFRDQAADFNEMIDKMPEGIKSLIGMGGGVEPLSPVGYLSHEIFAFVLPSILMIAAIGLGGAISGDEENGVLENFYSLPISRSRFVLERLGATAILLCALGTVSCVATIALAHTVNLGIGIGALVWATVNVLALTVAIGSITLFVGGITGRRSAAITSGTTVAIAGYIITSLAEAGIEFFRAIRFLSVFSLYNVVDVLRTGTPRWSLLGLTGVAFGFTSLALVAVERRDLHSA